MLPQFNDRAASRMFFLAIGAMGVSCCCVLPFGFLVAQNAAVLGLGVLGIFFGIGLFGYMAFNGLLQSRKAASTTTSEVHGESKVIARFATNQLGETIFAEEYVDFDDPGTRLYVRIGTPDGKRWELKTSRQVWENCGEGMRGRSSIQGDWLAAFEPIIGNP